ncbi:diaminopimelate decarboxylase [Rhodococcus sp. ARC_M6]|uniref:diaminopimelate decarboxylase n=1 Tax=Rhodococcus sp. ARC_M6 TaxID=2928852 RepID=UPI001FB3BB04|nr:diaminopimelate decarboxylase [Rhodococcus sp. ARC_M6]MCJ0903158.1 diaminopimelate decarboxylase [Rhodococcus sp. ARC_M6]
MTLLEIFPSLRGAMTPRMDPALWPISTRHDQRGRVCIGDVALEDIADQYGTPTYVVDESDVRHRCRTYREIFPDSEIVYAGKALMIRAMAKWVSEEGLGVDVCSAGELSIALAGGVDPSRIILHGNAKTVAELRAAARAGVGRIVIDSPSEAALLASVCTGPQKVLIRVTPGIDIHGHKAVSTGIVDQKFGLPAFSEELERTVAVVNRAANLQLIGLHCHLGSQITDPEYFRTAVATMIAQMNDIRRAHNLILTELDLGGGHGIAYRPGDSQLDLTRLACVIEESLDDACIRNRFPRPEIVLEPGRAIAARAGVTLYRVQNIKTVSGGRTFVSVDGGMSDNPRVSLYGSTYDVELVNRHSNAPVREVTVAGRHCESGDEIAVGTKLPADLHVGDLLGIPCTGAYHHSMASTYNSVCRPPVIAVLGGIARPLIRRESIDDLLAREVGM